MKIQPANCLNWLLLEGETTVEFIYLFLQWILFTSISLLYMLEVSVVYQATTGFVVNNVLLLDDLCAFYWKMWSKFKKQNRKKKQEQKSKHLSYSLKTQTHAEVQPWSKVLKIWGSLSSGLGTSWCFLLGELAAFKGNQKENGIILEEG